MLLRWKDTIGKQPNCAVDVQPCQRDEFVDQGNPVFNHGCRHSVMGAAIPYSGGNPKPHPS